MPAKPRPRRGSAQKGALPTKPLACALGTRRAVLARKSSRFGLERAWRELCRASLNLACKWFDGLTDAGLIDVRLLLDLCLTVATPGTAIHRFVPQQFVALALRGR